MRHARHRDDSFALETLEPRSMMAADLAPAGITLMNLNWPLVQGIDAQPMVFSVINVGDRRAPVGTRVRFYASRDTGLDSQDRPLRDSVIPAPIRPGERVTYTKYLKFPAGMDDGTYRIIMRVDPDNQIVESDESNNDLPSAPNTVWLPGKVESIDINKRFLRPGSSATVMARNVTGMDPDAGDVVFTAYSMRDPGEGGGIGITTLLGNGVRIGHDYALTFVPDASWLCDTIKISAVAVKHSQTSGSYAAQLTISARNIGPTIGSINFSSMSLTRGQSATATLTGIDPLVGRVSLYFDSNFDGSAQIANVLPTSRYHDAIFGSATPQGGAAQVTFVVPDWFPSVPSRVFVIAFSALGSGLNAVQVSRAYSFMLSAH